ncbi:TPA: fimbrial protein [Providencia alcalifaciens]|uniref:fimbrial protein n=1 Tax=Providencia alcalifaciens TaxID=126385 RepID=UPI002B062737|nr:fimbrial protein [Providencia alcalifaciens]
MKKNKLNQVLAAALISMSMSATFAFADEGETPEPPPTAPAANQGNGEITFRGAIIDAPCSINPESVEQTVELGQVSKVALKNGGKSIMKPFSIQLENCEIEKGKETVSVKFTGTESSEVEGALEINGSASGASVAIADNSGKMIKLGDKSPVESVVEGTTALNFKAYLQGHTDAGANVVPGDFTAVANFAMSYQ